jgi:very-short-patch-repair endonuclease
VSGAVDLSYSLRGVRRPLAEIERAIVALADAQHGVVSGRQLMDLGLTQRMIDSRVASGRLTRIHRGVYAVGRAQLGQRGRWKAATLAYGPRAILSHFSAAGLWVIRFDQRAESCDVVVEGSALRTVPTVWVHRMREMGIDDRAVVDGIPVTSLSLTALHLSALLRGAHLERAVIKAARRPEFELAQAVDLCMSHPRRPGSSRLLRILDRDLTAELRCLSELELRFVELLRTHRLPLPEINHDIEAMMVDAVWEDRRVAVELDGFEFHKLPRDLRSDNERSRRLTLAGYRTLRYVWQDLVETPARVVAELTALLFPADRST